MASSGVKRIGEQVVFANAVEFGDDLDISGSVTVLGGLTATQAISTASTISAAGAIISSSSVETTAMVVTESINLEFGATTTQNFTAATQTDNVVNPVTCNDVAGLITTYTHAETTGNAAKFLVNNTTVNSNTRVFAAVQDYSATYGTDGIPILLVQDVGANVFSLIVCNAGSTPLAGTLTVAFRCFQDSFVI